MAENIYFNKARWVDHDDIPLIPHATYLMVRPTLEIGDYTVTSDITDAEDFRFSIGLADEPPRVLALFDEFEDALEAALLIGKEREEFAIFYEGNEVTARISGWRDLGEKLAHQGHHQAWQSFDRAVSATVRSASGAPQPASIPSDAPQVIRTVIKRTLGY